MLQVWMGSRRFVHWRGDLAVPDRFSLSLDDPNFPFLVEMVASARPGVVECEQLAVSRRDDGPSVGGRRLRAIQVDRILNIAAESVAFRVEHGPEGSYYEPAHDVDVLPYTVRRGSCAKGRQPLTDEHLQKVADSYRAARGSRVRVAIANDPQWGRPVPIQTVARWIRAARDRGFLDEPVRREPADEEEKEEP